MITSRRSFLTILTGAIAAPIVVRSGLIMPVKAIVPAQPFMAIEDYLRQLMQPAMEQLAAQIEDAMIYGQAWTRWSPDGPTPVEAERLRDFAFAQGNQW